MKCPYCGGLVERDKGVSPSADDVGMFRNRLYHPQCYTKAKEEPKEKWPVNVEKAQTEEGAFNLALQGIIDYYNRELKISPDVGRIISQLKNFKRLASYKEILLALRYGYEIKHIDKTKSNGGIGIVPYILEDSQHYFERHQLEKVEFARKVEEQMRAIENMEVVVRVRRKKQKQPIAFVHDDD